MYVIYNITYKKKCICVYICTHKYLGLLNVEQKSHTITKL